MQTDSFRFCKRPGLFKSVSRVYRKINFYGVGAIRKFLTQEKVNNFDVTPKQKKKKKTHQWDLRKMIIGSQSHIRMTHYTFFFLFFNNFN